MATVEADFDLYLYVQGDKTIEEYYKIFTSTVDTINTNGGNAGLHPSVFKKYFEPMKEKGVEESGKVLTALTPADLEAIEEEATLYAKETTQGEYLVCLFLLLADTERYGPIKTQLDNNFLMGKQEYPSNVLAAKRLMTDCVPATGVVEHKREESGPSDVAFMERKCKGKWYPTCYCGGEQYPGG